MPMYSAAVKRLMREAAEMSTATSEYFAAPLEDNLFEWHFTVRGPEDTDFQVSSGYLKIHYINFVQGGIYHGRIIVPAEHPMKPPDIIFLTVRFCWAEVYVHVEACFSNSIFSQMGGLRWARKSVCP